MNKRSSHSNHLWMLFATTFLMFLSSCGDDDSLPQATGTQVQFTLGSAGSSGVSGMATFAKLDNNSTLITLSLTGTTASGDHPTHVHMNTAAEGGAIVIDLTNVDGTGASETTVSTFNDGTAVTYDELIAYDGYINVHNSASDLGTLIAQGDIGVNELIGNSESYSLFSVSNPAISGTATFSERANTETLVVIELDGDATDSDHPAHIHMNTASEGGGIVIDLTNITGGLSKSNITAFNDGTAVTYTELLAYDGYINVHNTSTDLGTLVAQGDIGVNELTGSSKVYDLLSVSDPAISGSATFSERTNGEILVVIELDGDATDSDHPAHIHMNTASEGGAIVIDLISITGGLSKSNITAFNDGTTVTYTELITYNGYINVHNTSMDLGTLVAQGDIGQNELIGTSVTYPLNTRSDPNVSGEAKFSKRANGETLITIVLTGTVDGGDHPAHIHMGSAATGGTIVLDLTNVNGATGVSKTNGATFNDGTAVTYDELINYNGYINVHNSAADLGTLIAQGDIGSNG